MSIKPIPEEDLRAALRPYRADADGFEAGIRARIEAVPTPRQDLDSETQSPMFRVAAAVLPWPLVAGGNVVGGGAKLSSIALGQKVLGYAALPAISLFLLIGTALFSALKIRAIQKANHPDISDEKEMHDAVGQWWSRHKWGALLVFAGVLTLPMIGATWLLFLLLLVSFGSLLYLLSGFAGLGVGNRLMIGQSCCMGLLLLAQVMQNRHAGRRDIHFVDQMLISAVFYVGVLILIPFVIGGMKRLGISGVVVERKVKTPLWLLLFCLVVIANWLLVLVAIDWSASDRGPVVGNNGWLLLGSVLFGEVAFLIGLSVRHFRRACAERFAWGRSWFGALLCTFVVVSLVAWLTKPIWRPATPERIRHYVESFEKGRFAFIDWREWEIAASWTIEAGLEPDLSRARALLDDELSGEQHPLVLGSAFRVGLVETGQIDQLAGLAAKRQSLLPKASYRIPHQITSLNQYEWAIYALAESDQLSPQDRDFLEQRLLATIDELAGATANVLETALRVTQLLDVIDRPINRDEYRERVHRWLREFHCKKTHGFKIAGGFAQHKGLASSLQTTSHAIELMKIYGVPEDLDLNWVRSNLRPLHYRSGHDEWIAAVTLDRLNRLPGVSGPTWLEIIYYERSLFAAMLLVAFCIYATLSSPVINAPSNHDDVADNVS